ncbi:MAG: archease [Isosphaeraceae bacterium]|nr:archease [Isosphaeraceae bacterium]
MFDHTADVGMRVEGRDLADLLETAAGGLFDAIAVDRSRIRPLEVEEVVLQAESTLDLFADWLSELIYRAEVGRKLYGKFEVEARPDERSLHAWIWGEPIDLARHEFGSEVKAVTRHGLIVERRADGSWFAETILDI